MLLLSSRLHVAFTSRQTVLNNTVYVFDIRTLTAPKQVNFIRTANNSYVGEGAVYGGSSDPAASVWPTISTSS